MYFLFLRALVAMAWWFTIQLSAMDTKNQPAALLGDQCGQYWFNKYTEFHETELKKSRPHLIVAVPHPSGFSDRVTGFVTICLLGMLTDRAFQIAKFPGLLDIETSFTSPHINWTRAVDPGWLIEPLKEHAAQPRNYNQSILTSGQYNAVNTINNIRLQDDLIDLNLTRVLGTSDTVLMSANRGKTVRLSENPHHGKELALYGLGPYNTFGCLVNYLMQPKEDIFASIPAIATRMKDPNPSILKISIQIREGDHVFSSGHAGANVLNYRTYFKCAEQIEAFAKEQKGYTDVVWYLTSDSTPLRVSAKQQYGDKLLTDVDHHVTHSAAGTSSGDVAGFNLAAAEWWLMGYAHYHVITKTSGFGRTAGFRSLRKDVIYTVHPNRKNQDAYANCINTSSTDLENLFYDWSGI